MKDEPPFGASRTNVACPGCGFAPYVGMHWLCGPDGCGGTFDTFATRARCPHCEAQFLWTMCPACGKTHSHQAWYRTRPDPVSGP